MKRSELEWIIEDYCSRYEIEITADQLSEALETLLEKIEYQTEYNYRCGIYSVDINIMLDSYFSDL